MAMRCSQSREVTSASTRARHRSCPQLCDASRHGHAYSRHASQAIAAMAESGMDTVRLLLCHVCTPQKDVRLPWHPSVPSSHGTAETVAALHLARCRRSFPLVEHPAPPRRPSIDSLSAIPIPHASSPLSAIDQEHHPSDNREPPSKKGLGTSEVLCEHHTHYCYQKGRPATTLLSPLPPARFRLAHAVGVRCAGRRQWWPCSM